MTTYTPGPWAPGRHPHNIVGIVNGVSEIVAMVGDMPCVNGHDDLAAERGSEMERANARLIAAAPELLGQHEADMVDLELLAKAIHAGDQMPELVIRITDMLNRKAAAIAKATGAQP